MKNLLPFLFFLLLFGWNYVTAQCPPPGFPIPSGDCATAPVFCDGIDGYCDTLDYSPNGPTQCCLPGCNWLFFDNEQYFAFVAGTTSISIQVSHDSCILANGVDGLGGSITEGCSGPIMDFNCMAFNPPGIFTLTSDNYVVGETYYMVLMGYGGSSCDYSIAVTSGLTYYDVPPGLGAITGPVDVCEGSTASYTVAGAGGSSPGWEIVPPEMGSFVNTNAGGTVGVAWEMSGTAQLCIADNPACPTNPVPACLTVTIGPLGLGLAASPANCGISNGAIDLTVNDGTPPFTFAWSNGATTEDVSGLAIGTYTVTVTGANGCSSTGSAAVTDATPPMSAPGTPAANTACGSPNGGVDLMPVGGIPPLGFAWSNGSSLEDLTGVSAGTYNVTVTDVNGCSTTASFTVADQPSVPSPSLTVTAATCGLSNGAVNLSVSGGAPPYSYTWSNGATTEDLANVPAASYTVTVTGSNGCTATATATVPGNNVSITLSGGTSANTTCSGGNGAVNLSVMPAVPPAGSYIFAWSNGATTEDISGLAPGNYAVTVSLGTGCTASASFTVADQPSVPNLSALTASDFCGGGNGGIDLTASGGAPPYTFAWSNSATTEDLSGLATGPYTVTATGANGCTSTFAAFVAAESVAIDIGGTTTPNTSCTAANGSVVTAVTPPQPPAGLNYTYAWNTGANTQDIFGLPVGSYTVTVSLGTTCTATASFTVGSGPQVPSPALAATPEGCDGPGSINLTVSGGVPPYAFLWSNTATTEDLPAVPAGSYTVTVTGSDGCTATGSATVGVNTAGADTTAVSGTTCDPGDVGVFEQLLVNQAGCDSLVVTTVSLLAADTTAISGTSCDINDVGVFQQLLTNGNGCDSLIVTTITYAAADTTAISGTSCDVNDVGIFEQLLVNSNGCDSLIVTTISYS
ncbi:MAG: hypothetical protein HY842_02770, partial [Bacteroidetes bacterium]|nr:hypothetical protein [Bacteroidota bacterium]